MLNIFNIEDIFITENKIILGDRKIPFLYGDFKSLLLKIVKQDHSHFPILTKYFANTISEISESLNVNLDFLNDLKYQCTFNKTEHYFLTPFCLLTDNFKKYKEFNLNKTSIYIDFLNSKNEQISLFKSLYPNKLLNTLQLSLLGSGFYNDENIILPFLNLEYIALKIENNDYLIFAAYLKE